MSGITSEMLDARQRATLNAINQIFNPGPVLNSANDGDEGNLIRNPQGAQKKAFSAPRKNHSRPKPAQNKDIQALQRDLEQLFGDNFFREAGPFLAPYTLTYPTPTTQDTPHTQDLAQLLLALHDVATVS